MKKFAATLIAIASFTLYAFTAQAATEAEMQQGVDSGRNLGTSQATQNPTAAASGTFNSASGAGEYSSLGEPANGGVSGGKAASTYQTAINCNTPRTKYLGGIGLKYGTCALDASANVTAVPFSVCTKSQAGGICGTGDWSSFQTVAKGGSKTFAGGKVVVKLVSCDFETCQATLTDNDKASGTGDDLNTQGQAMVAAEGSDSLAGTQASVYGGGTYHAAITGARSEVNCYNNNSKSLETDGTVKTCDGQQTASFDPGCKTVTECLAQNTTTKTWTEVCEAEVPLTTKSCTTTTPTVDCEEKLTKQQVSCANSLSVSCLASSSVVAKVPVTTNQWWCDTCDGNDRANEWRATFASAATQAGNTVVNSSRYIPQVCTETWDGLECTGGGTEYIATASGGAPVTLQVNSTVIGSGYVYIFHPEGRYGRMSIDGRAGTKSGKPEVYFKALADCPNKVWQPATKDYPGHWACPSTITGCPAGSTIAVIEGKYTCIGELTYVCTDTWADGCVGYK